MYHRTSGGDAFAKMGRDIPENVAKVIT